MTSTLIFSPTHFEKHFQPQPYIQFAFSTWPVLPFSIVACYLLFVALTPRIMMDRKPFHLQNIVACWNLFLTIFSFFGTTRTIPYMFHLLRENSFHNMLCLPYDVLDPQDVCGLWTMLFVYSKIVELLDTVFIVLSKKKLIFLHWYHHATVLLVAWHCYAYRLPFSTYFMTMNYSVHTIMYGYYFLKSIHKWPQWISPQFITIAQILQMVAGSWICFMTYVLWRDDDVVCFLQLRDIMPAGVMYISYLCLFVHFFTQRFFPLTQKQKTKIGIYDC